MATDNRKKAKTKVGVHVMVVVFGITSWSVMNGLWVELPILVSHLPEGWALPSYLTIVAQFGNIGPLLFSLMVYAFPSTKLEKPASVFIVGALSIVALLYAYFWRDTAAIGGRMHSVALLSLTWVQAVFAATTSMAYLAFMAHLKAQYMASLFIGMGLSGLIPAFVALGQGAGDIRCNERNTSSLDSLGTLVGMSRDTASTTTLPGLGNTDNVTSNIEQTISTLTAVVAVNQEPSFTVKAFFLLLFLMGMLSMLSLLMLTYHPYCKTEHVNTDAEEDTKLMKINRKPNTQVIPADDGTQPLSYTKISANDSRHSRLENGGESYNGDDEVSVPVSTSFDDVTFSDPSDLKQTDDDISVQGEGKQGSELTQLESWYLLLLQVWINVLQTSYVLAIQVYSSLPYGLFVYNGVTKAENIVDPIACFVSLFVTAKTTKVITGLTLLGTLFTAYIVTVAAMSPNPFLLHETAGGILVIAAWVMCTMFMVYAKVSIANVMRSQGRTSLLWTGGSTQLGSFIGAVLAYVMINHLHLFKDGPLCR